MFLRRTRLAAVVTAAALTAVSLLGAPAGAAAAGHPSASAVTRGTIGPTGDPKGYLMETLPDLDTAMETTTPGSIIVTPGEKTVRVGKKSIRLGFVIHFKTGGPVTYGIQEKIKGKWYDMASLTKGDPLDNCAMGGPGWTAQAWKPGKVQVRGFSRQDGRDVFTPAYTVTIVKK